MFWKWLFSRNKIRVRESYAVTTGTYAGEIFIFVEEKDNKYHFLAIPVIQNRVVPKEKFQLALQSDILKYVRRIPKKVFSVVHAQYDKNNQNA